MIRITKEDMEKVLFIGLGNMGSSLVHGILKNNDLHAEIYGYDHTDRSQTKALSENPRLRGLRSLEDINKFNIDTIVLGVRPENTEPLLRQIASLGVAGKTIISMVGNVSLDYLSEFFPHSHVLRILPNMNAKIQKSITAITTKNAPQEVIDFVDQLFRNSGSTIFIDEDKWSTFSAIAGSAPAFVFLFYHAMIDFALNHGFDIKDAYQIIGDMIVGSVHRAMNSSLDLNTLAEMIATPGGSTAKGMRILEKNHFEEVIELALEATRKKAK